MIKAGDKVVCIDNSYFQIGKVNYFSNIKPGNVYEIKPFNNKSPNSSFRHKKKPSLSKEEYYEIYNAGRNAGLIEGSKLI
jgi:hypothetical protein